MDVACYTAPLPKARAEEYRRFLHACDLRDEADADVVALLTEGADERILACGALSGNTVKQLAVDPSLEGTGACASVLSALMAEAFRRDITHLFLCTKPEHKRMFQSFGFYPLAETESALLMENRRDGLARFLSSLPRPSGRVGAVVCNCNPFTLGHRYLIERAAADCDALHVFVLSEDASQFSGEERFHLVKAGTADLANCYVHQSEEYLVSRATFPAYFIKDGGRVDAMQADLDIALFAERIAPALGIRVRYVGEEPYCAVTKAYNERMKTILPQHGIELKELARYNGISASHVRMLMKQADLAAIRPLVPETTYAAILRHLTTDS